MRNELAESLLGRVMGWDTAELIENVPDLQALAQISYDEYGHYGPGSKFIENLAAWLDQLPDEKKGIALDFVKRGLVFISNAQMRHLISLVPAEIIDHVIRTRVAQQLGVPPYGVRGIEADPAFGHLRRRSLVLGASDGAHLDVLRRASAMSHEQFSQDLEPTGERLEKMREKLTAAIAADEPSAFAHVFVVDDFAGSGKTMVRSGKEGEGVAGKLVSLKARLESLATDGFVEAGVPGTVILYTASEQALEQIRWGFGDLGLEDWEVFALQVIRRQDRVDENFPEMAELCREFFDRSTIDEHKGETPIGYDNCALPLVLSHNAPNNSVCLIWMDTRGDEGSANLRALFPRYERHHRDRR